MQVKIVNVSEEIRDVLLKAKSIANKYKVDGLNKMIKELEFIINIINEQKKDLNIIYSIADDTIANVNSMLKKIFLKNKNEELEETFKPLKTLLSDDDAFDVLSTEDKIKMNNEIMHALKKMHDEKKKRNINMLSNMPDYNDFKSNFVVKNNKTIFDNIYKDPVTNVTSIINNDKSINKPMMNVSKQSPMEIARKYESLVGQFTTEKLAAERKLALAHKVLKLANDNIMQSSLNDLMNDDFEKLKSDLEKAFDEKY